MRSVLPILALLLLASCTDEGLNPIADAAIDELNPFDEEGDPEALRGTTLTREAVTKADVATVRMRLVDEEQPGYYFASSSNGGYITYASSFRQTLTLRGSAITGTRGLGFDLLSSTSSQPDPVKQPIPPERWPSRITRSYEFPGEGPQGRIEVFECRFEPGEFREIVILQQRHRGVEISETCSGPTGEFENLYFADIRTGFVWRSLQWTGPRQGLFDLEVILPYTGN